MVLIAIVVIVTLCIAIYLLIHVPLCLTLLSEFEKARHLYSKIGGCWGPFGVQFRYENGEKIILFLFLQYTLFTHQFKEGETQTDSIHKETKKDLLSKTEEKGLNYHLETLQQIFAFIVHISPKVRNFLELFLNSLRIKCIETDIRFGTGDPASTGCIFGIFSSVRPLLVLHRNVNFIFSPDLEEMVLEGEIKVILFVECPFLILLSLFQIIFSTKTWVSIINIGRRFS